MNLYHTGLSELYKEIEALGDPLTEISDRIDFERIRPILSDLFTNDTDKGGRPNRSEPPNFGHFFLLLGIYS